MLQIDHVELKGVIYTPIQTTHYEDNSEISKKKNLISDRELTILSFLQDLDTILNSCDRKEIFKKHSHANKAAGKS